jgi:hypothetical protein
MCVKNVRGKERNVRQNVGLRFSPRRLALRYAALHGVLAAARVRDLAWRALRCLSRSAHLRPVARLGVLHTCTRLLGLRVLDQRRVLLAPEGGNQTWRGEQLAQRVLGFVQRSRGVVERLRGSDRLAVARGRTLRTGCG